MGPDWRPRRCALAFFDASLNPQRVLRQEGKGSKADLEGGDAHVGATFEAHDEHTSGLKIPSPVSIRVERCCCGQRNGPNR
jgi:hypothetical protein